MKHFYCLKFFGLITLVLLAACSRNFDSINMSEAEEANKALIRQVFAAIDAQDFDQLRQILAEDFELHYVGESEPIDREATFDLIRGFYTAFPDYTHVIEEMVAEGDQVAVKLNFHATHQAEFEGIPPTGKRISYAGADIVTIVDGMATEVWALEDALGLMSQLGMQLTLGDPEQMNLPTGEYLLATEDLDQRFTEGMSRKDIEQVMSCFWNSPDVILVTFDGTVFRGFDNVRKAVEQLFTQSESLSLAIDEVSHIRQGDSVFAVGTATYEMRTKEGISQKITERWTDVRRKVDGRWVYVLDHAHALVPDQ
jgi:uncharacterized protein (TIGR02246 family)